MGKTWAASRTEEDGGDMSSVVERHSAVLFLFYEEKIMIKDP